MRDDEWDDGELQRRNPHAADWLNPLSGTREHQRTRLMSKDPETQSGGKGKYGPCCQRQSFHGDKLFRLFDGRECNNSSYIERSIRGSFPECCHKGAQNGLCAFCGSN